MEEDKRGMISSTDHLPWEDVVDLGRSGRLPGRGDHRWYFLYMFVLCMYLT